jgi:16S rRNA G966 N2-methylase RsmD
MENIIIERLFPKIEKDFNKLMIDTESISYITTPNTSEKITKIIKEYSSKCNFKINNVIDCTGCVGGDTISFGKSFNTVTSIELDKQKYKFLQNNVKIYGLNNVNVINSCCIDYIKNSSASDVVYIDPPWGGKNYKNKHFITLSIGDMTIEEFSFGVFNGMFKEGEPKILALKLPKNYDYVYFCKNININNDMKIIKHQLNKIDLLIIMKLNTYLPLKIK